MVSLVFPKTACTEVQLAYSWPADYRVWKTKRKPLHHARKETGAARQTIPQYPFIRAR